jgi:hypothetical protein
LDDSLTNLSTVLSILGYSPKRANSVFAFCACMMCGTTCAIIKEGRKFVCVCVEAFFSESLWIHRKLAGRGIGQTRFEAATKQESNLLQKRV